MLPVLQSSIIYLLYLMLEPEKQQNALDMLLSYDLLNPIVASINSSNSSIISSDLSSYY